MSVVTSGVMRWTFKHAVPERQKITYVRVINQQQASGKVSNGFCCLQAIVLQLFVVMLV